MKTVWIRFGSEDSAPAQAFEFDTEAEINAFLSGVDSAIGWMDFTQFDSEEEANAQDAAQ